MSFTAVPQSDNSQKPSPRAQLLVQVECRESEAYSLGRSQNVSQSGILVSTPETFEPETEVAIRFWLPAPQPIPIEANGVVVRFHPGKEMGIKFLQLSDQDRQAISTYVDRTRIGLQ